jgi:long-subunit acyl-CoA synthetase (AMP-forming)
MYTTLLGVLSAGGSVVPIDASNTPVDRVLFMLGDAEADIVVYDDLNRDFACQIKEKSENEHGIFTAYGDIVEKGKNQAVETGQRSARIARPTFSTPRGLLDIQRVS